MAGKPDERSHLKAPDPEHAEPECELDHLGPVTIERLSKEDGRALIVYRLTKP
jgi:hypothetical protein